MNHGGMVYVGRDNKIRLSEDLLSPLSLIENTHLTGLFYPTPPSSDYQAVEEHPDFMLTPIPYWAWPVAAGLRIELKHKPGALSTITSFLNDRQINIINSHCTRSGHLYATWNLVVEFEGLRSEGEVSLERLDDLSKLVPQMVEKLRDDIKLHCADALQEEKGPYLRDPVGAWALKALSNFYRYSKETNRKPLEAQCISRDTVDMREAGTIRDWDKLASELPTLGFASLDTEHFNIRIAVLRRSELHRFRSVSFSFSLLRHDEGIITSRGVLDSVAQQLRSDFDLWRVYSEDQKDDSHRELRTINLFMEQTKTSQIPNSEIDTEVTRRLESIPLKLPRISLARPVRVSSISPRRIFVSIRNPLVFQRRDEFFDAIRDLAGEIGVLKEDIVTVESYTAQSITKTVASAIESCTGMLQFYMGDTSQDPSLDWLNAEFFLASYLKIPCIRFVEPGFENRILLERDRGNWPLKRDVPPKALHQTLTQALRELDREMPRNPRPWSY